MTQKDKISYAAYGEFMYQAGSWDYPRRVVCKIEKPTDRLVHLFTFIVTNIDSSQEDIVRICPYKDEFYETLENIRSLQLNLE